MQKVYVQLMNTVVILDVNQIILSASKYDSIIDALQAKSSSCPSPVPQSPTTNQTSWSVRCSDFPVNATIYATHSCADEAGKEITSNIVTCSQNGQTSDIGNVHYVNLTGLHPFYWYQNVKLHYCNALEDVDPFHTKSTEKPTIRPTILSSQITPVSPTQMRAWFQHNDEHCDGKIMYTCNWEELDGASISSCWDNQCRAHTLFCASPIDACSHPPDDPNHVRMEVHPNRDYVLAMQACRPTDDLSLPDCSRCGAISTATFKTDPAASIPPNLLAVVQTSVSSIQLVFSWTHDDCYADSTTIHVRASHEPSKSMQSASMDHLLCVKRGEVKNVTIEIANLTCSTPYTLTAKSCNHVGCSQTADFGLISITHPSQQFLRLTANATSTGFDLYWNVSQYESCCKSPLSIDWTVKTIGGMVITRNHSVIDQCIAGHSVLIKLVALDSLYPFRDYMVNAEASTKFFKSYDHFIVVTEQAVPHPPRLLSIFTKTYQSASVVFEWSEDDCVGNNTKIVVTAMSEDSVGFSVKAESGYLPCGHSRPELVNVELLGLNCESRYNISAVAVNDQGTSAELSVDSNFQIQLKDPGRPEIRITNITSSELTAIWLVQKKEIHCFTGFELAWNFTDCTNQVFDSGIINATTNTTIDNDGPLALLIGVFNGLHPCRPYCVQGFLQADGSKPVRFKEWTYTNASAPPTPLAKNIEVVAESDAINVLWHVNDEELVANRTTLVAKAFLTTGLQRVTEHVIEGHSHDVGYVNASLSLGKLHAYRSYLLSFHAENVAGRSNQTLTHSTTVALPPRPIDMSRITVQSTTDSATIVWTFVYDDLTGPSTVLQVTPPGCVPPFTHLINESQLLINNQTVVTFKSKNVLHPYREYGVNLTVTNQAGDKTRAVNSSLVVATEPAAPNCTAIKCEHSEPTEQATTIACTLPLASCCANNTEVVVTLFTRDGTWVNEFFYKNSTASWQTCRWKTEHLFSEIQLTDLHPYRQYNYTVTIQNSCAGTEKPCQCSLMHSAFDTKPTRPVIDVQKGGPQMHPTSLNVALSFSYEQCNGPNTVFTMNTNRLTVRHRNLVTSSSFYKANQSIIRPISKLENINTLEENTTQLENWRLRSSSSKVFKECEKDAVPVLLDSQGLLPYHAYLVTVHAYNDAGQAAPDEWHVTTLPISPHSVDQISITFPFPSRVKVKFPYRPESCTGPDTKFTIFLTSLDGQGANQQWTSENVQDCEFYEMINVEHDFYEVEPYASYEVAVSTQNSVDVSANVTHRILTSPERPRLSEQHLSFPKSPMYSRRCARQLYKGQLAFLVNASWFVPGRGPSLTGFEVVIAKSTAITDDSTFHRTDLMNKAGNFSSFINGDVPSFVAVSRKVNIFEDLCCIVDDSSCMGDWLHRSLDLGVPNQVHNTTVVLGYPMCRSAGDCDGPLAPGQNYTILIRAFAYTDFFKNPPSDPVLMFQKAAGIAPVTPANHTVVIVVTVVVLCSIGIVAVIFTVLRRRSAVASTSTAPRSRKVSFSTRTQEGSFDASEFYEAPDMPPETSANATRPISAANFSMTTDKMSLDGNFGFLEEYENLEDLSKQTVDPIFMKEARLPHNMPFNRFTDILPFDYNRVKLVNASGDYINASFIDGYNREREYIATQGPIGLRECQVPSSSNASPKRPTTTHFWNMVWQRDCRFIVMLTNCTEKARTKCAKYWPDNIDETKLFGEIGVTLLITQCKKESLYRRFLISKGEQRRKITHFHYTSWPDRETPRDVLNLLDFVEYVRCTVDEEAAGPLIVHCSAGVGRTGTYIAIDILMQQLRTEEAIDVFYTVLKLRHQRQRMVQNDAQYALIYKCLDALLKRERVHRQESIEDGLLIRPKRLMRLSKSPAMQKISEAEQMSSSMKELGRIKRSAIPARTGSLKEQSTVFTTF